MILRMTLLLFTAAAAVKDIQCRSISNALIGAAIVNGFFLQLSGNGLYGLIKAAVGMGIPVVLCGWLFVLAMMGAGDLKLLMAVGVYMGPKGTIGVIVLAFISGAVMSMTQLMKHGIFRERMQYLWNYIQQTASGKREPYMDMTCPEKSEKWTICFAVPVFMAVVMMSIADVVRVLG